MIAQIFRKMTARVPANTLRYLINFWPPFVGAGIKVLTIGSDYRDLKVMLKKRWYNSNYVGTQFGGSIYAMTDPFYMMMLMNNLESDYIVWDKAARVDFILPGRTELFADFKVDQAILDRVRQNTLNGEKYIFELPIAIYDKENSVVAQVIKTIYVRKKKSKIV